MSSTGGKVNPWTLGWEQRLANIGEMLRATSTYHEDPQQSVRGFVQRMRGIVPTDRAISISRRGLDAPYFRITRSTTWETPIDPWRQQSLLPVLQGGLMGELLYAGQPRYIRELHVPRDDPGYEYFAGMNALMALPTWEEGNVLNMVLQLVEDASTFDPERLPEMLWVSNLFGRSTRNLVLAREVKEAYAALDREMKIVGDIQMSLLPRETPSLNTLELATHYQTSTRAGGDYYDFFDLGNGKWGLIIADVSGHGTPAAVLMAILHAIAHLMPMHAVEPHDALAFLNRSLSRRYTAAMGAFVTAIYAVYDDSTRTLRWANAGHPQPLVREPDGRVHAPDCDPASVPLGILDEASYETAQVRLSPGQSFVLYTDGITEAFSPTRELYGESRLFDAITRGGNAVDKNAGSILGAVIEDVGAFSGLTNRSDDRTLVVGTVK